jgi:hypothetical protein
MKKLFLLCLSLCIVGLTNMVNAAPVSETAALVKAKKFFFEKNTSVIGLSKVSANIPFTMVYKGINTLGVKKVSGMNTSNSQPYFYVYNIGENRGFIIVSGDDATKAILGYSNEGSFQAENIPANLSEWLDFYKIEIQYAIDKGLPTADENTPQKVMSSTSEVVPLLGNIKFNQDVPYNDSCPSISGTKTVTGCVATAMAQIMKYYQWPVTGTKSHSYTWNSTTLSANFGATTYDWANMLNAYSSTATGTTTQRKAIATLLYHCGVAVNMNYNTATNGGSAANNLTAAVSLITYFGYDASIQYISRSNYTYSDWTNLLKTELNAARPILYAATTTVNGGHAFVCDGYDSNELFHINWGWAGQSNGYFELTTLSPDVAGIVGVLGGYSQYQTAIIGIQKATGLTTAAYNLGIYSKPLTSSVSTLSDLSTTLSLNFGAINNGLSSFSGKIGIALYLNGVLRSVLNNFSVSDLGSGYYYPSLTKTVSLSGVASGTYRLVCIYQPTGASDWSEIKGTPIFNNYLNVVISGSTATISTPLINPSLELTSSVAAASSVYNNRNASFNFTVKNSGTEYYSNIRLALFNADSTVNQIINYGMSLIKAGETKTFSFSGLVTVTAGTYFAVVQYDNTYSGSTSHYTNILPSTFNPIRVTVLAEPAAPSINTTASIVYSSPTITRNESATLTANILNSGGYYNNYIMAVIYASSFGSRYCLKKQIN